MTAAGADPFAALGDAHRRQIVAILANGEHSVQELANALPISRPAVSRHLRLLREARLVTDRPVGVRRLYSLDDRGAQEVRSYMQEIWGEAMARFKMAAENTSTR